MAIIQFVPEKKILKTALKLVKKATKTLYVTMIMKKEIHTTSKKYLRLLKKKLKEGVIVKRIGFGTEKEYKIILKQFNFKSTPPNFSFKLCSDLGKAQRLLIVDEKEMLFAVYINKKDKLVFYTKSKDIINGFVNYFNKIFDNIGILIL